MAFGDWQGFLGTILTLATAVVLAASWINNRLNSLLREMIDRFDLLENKYASKESLDSLRGNFTERHKEHDRRITRLEMTGIKQRLKDAESDSEN